jgi:shikimate kinase
MSGAVDRPIFLVGFMGCGKTRVGAALASRLGWSSVDTDRWIVQRAGRSVEDIFEGLGEARFRSWETDALREFAAATRAVVATGGGLFMSRAHREMIRDRGISVWLDASLERIRTHLKGSTGRPLWVGQDPIAVRAMYECRRAAYALADIRVDADRGGIDEVAEHVRMAVFR